MNHVFEFLFGFNLFIEHTKCDVLEENQSVLFVINESFLSKNIDKRPKLLILADWSKPGRLVYD